MSETELENAMLIHELSMTDDVVLAATGRFMKEIKPAFRHFIDAEVQRGTQLGVSVEGALIGCAGLMQALVFSASGNPADPGLAEKSMRMFVTTFILSSGLELKDLKIELERRA